MEDILKEIETLKKEVKVLKQKRIFQQDIVPQSVKGRHIGEGPWLVRSGLDANKPSVPPTGTDSSAIYFATDTDKLYIWNGAAWVSATLS